MKNKIIFCLIIFFILFIPSLVSSQEVGPFPINKEFILTQNCNNCTNCNLSSIKYPNSTIILSNKVMNNAGSGEFNYTIPESYVIVTGKWDYRTFCWNYQTGETGIGGTTFYVTKTGTLLTVQEALIYLLLAFVSLILFFIVLYFVITLPYKDKVDLSKGLILLVPKTKYLKIGLILILHVLLVAFFNLLISIADSFSILEKSYSTLSFIFQILTILSLPLFIIIIVWAGYQMLRDIKINSLINKFGYAFKNA